VDTYAIPGFILNFTLIVVLLAITQHSWFWLAADDSTNHICLQPVFMPSERVLNVGFGIGQPSYFLGFIATTSAMKQHSPFHSTFNSNAHYLARPPSSVAM